MTKLCIECNNEIPALRLQYKPEAIRCVQCQTVHEKKTGEGIVRGVLVVNGKTGNEIALVNVKQLEEASKMGTAIIRRATPKNKLDLNT